MLAAAAEPGSSFLPDILVVLGKVFRSQKVNLKLISYDSRTNRLLVWSSDECFLTIRKIKKEVSLIFYNL